MSETMVAIPITSEITALQERIIGELSKLLPDSHIEVVGSMTGSL